MLLRLLLRNSSLLADRTACKPTAASSCFNMFAERTACKPNTIAVTSCFNAMSMQVRNGGMNTGRGGRRRCISNGWGGPPTSRFRNGRMRMFGYSRPFRRDPNKVVKLPNRELRWYDFRPSIDAFGQVRMLQPYPPRVNRSIKCLPQGKQNMWPTQVHKQYPLKWKGIIYQYTPKLNRKPHGGQPWGGEVIRLGSREERRVGPKTDDFKESKRYRFGLLKIKKKRN